MRTSLILRDTRKDLQNPLVTKNFYSVGFRLLAKNEVKISSYSDGILCKRIKQSNAHSPILGPEFKNQTVKLRTKTESICCFYRVTVHIKKIMHYCSVWFLHITDLILEIILD